jgi:hypothetical protein
VPEKSLKLDFQALFSDSLGHSPALFPMLLKRAEEDMEQHDSSPANQKKYFSLLEQTRTHNDLFYVGPREKEQFLGYS